MRKRHLLFVKSIRDLTRQKGRTLLVFLAVLTGIFGLTLVSSNYASLSRNITPNFLETNPPSIVIRTKRLPADLINRLRMTPGVAAMEIRGVFTARLENNLGENMLLFLHVVEDMDDLRVAKIFPETGSWPPTGNELLLERMALPVSGLEPGRKTTITVPGFPIEEVVIAGTVHDPGQAPAWMEGHLYGYMTAEQLRNLGWQLSRTRLLVTVDFNIYNRAKMESLAATLHAQMKHAGFPPADLYLPEPAVHPHEGQMRSLVFLLFSFGLITLLLSAVLASTMMASYMESQIRQIGILKSLGASTAIILRHYLITSAIPLIAAALIGYPLGFAGGAALSEFFAGLLNFNIIVKQLPFWFYAAMLGTGLLLPFLTTLNSVLTGARMPVRKALFFTGLEPQGQKSQKAAARKKRSLSLGNPRFVIRNILRKRWRFFMTLFTLVIGGVLFLSALNVRESVDTTVVNAFGYQRYDLMVIVDRTVDEKRLSALLDPMEDIQDYELFLTLTASIQGQTSPAVTEISLLSINPFSPYLSFEYTAGGWEGNPDPEGILLNNMAITALGEIEVGDYLDFTVGDQQFHKRVDGIIRDPIIPPRIYINSSRIPIPGYNSVLIAYRGRSDSPAVSAGHTAFLQKFMGKTEERIKIPTDLVEKKLFQAGFNIIRMYRTEEMLKIAMDHMKVATIFLLLLSFLTIFIAGMSLIMTLRLNLRDRRRETAILKAVGAGRKIINRLITRESLLTAGMAWLLAIILSWPVSRILSHYFGNLFFDTALDFVFSNSGPILWLLLSWLFALAASIGPIREARRMSVAAAVRYE